MKFKFLVFFLVSTLLLNIVQVEALRPREKKFRTPEDAQIYFDSHYNCGFKYYQKGQWNKAAQEFEPIVFFFPKKEETANVYYLLGVSYYEMQEYDLANNAFSEYLKTSKHPEFFEETIEYKYCIADHFKAGAKRRPFSHKYCPKWLSAKTTAVSVYDEIIMAVPNHERTAFALYAKGCLLQSLDDYYGSIDAFQTLARRFPKHELAPEAYLRISQAYCMQSNFEFQNPDILALAELNVRRFETEFPRDEHLEEARGYVARIKEIYAKGLCDLGRFYERTGHPTASAIYYRSAIEEFPDTEMAEFCMSRLKANGLDNPEACEPESIPAVPPVATPETTVPYEDDED